jgi:hypothetical protein
MEECSICFQENFIYRKLNCCKNVLCFYCNTKLSEKNNYYHCPFCRDKVNSVGFPLEVKILYKSLFLSSTIDFSVLEKEMKSIDNSNPPLFDIITRFISLNICIFESSKPKDVKECVFFLKRKQNVQRLIDLVPLRGKKKLNLSLIRIE